MKTENTSIMHSNCAVLYMLPQGANEMPTTGYKVSTLQSGTKMVLRSLENPVSECNMQHYFVLMPRHQCSNTKCEHSRGRGASPLQGYPQN